MLWHRNEMKRDRSGILRCPDDQAGLGATSLDQANAAGTRRKPRPQRDPGGIDNDAPTDAEIALNQERLFILFGVDV